MSRGSESREGLESGHIEHQHAAQPAPVHESASRELGDHRRARLPGRPGQPREIFLREWDIEADRARNRNAEIGDEIEQCRREAALDADAAHLFELLLETRHASPDRGGKFEIDFRIFFGSRLPCIGRKAEQSRIAERLRSRFRGAIAERGTGCEDVAAAREPEGHVTHERGVPKDPKVAVHDDDDARAIQGSDRAPGNAFEPPALGETLDFVSFEPAPGSP